MTHWFDRSLVVAADYRVPDAAHVWPTRAGGPLPELGAHHVVVYTGAGDPERVLAIAALADREPLLEVMRSPAFLDWFDAAGVQDIPAVFAGELVERIAFDPREEPEVPEVVAVLVTPVVELSALAEQIRHANLPAAGVRKVLVFSAFDNPGEVMMLFHINDASDTADWLTHSPTTADWLEQAGVGAYPPLFVGRYQHMLRLS